jgi:hypothetical protein
LLQNVIVFNIWKVAFYTNLSALNTDQVSVSIRVTSSPVFNGIVQLLREVSRFPTRKKRDAK